MVRDELCISCYNRQLEVIRGVNARGTKPVRARPLREFTAIVSAAGAQRRVGLALVAHGIEAALRIEQVGNEPLIVGYSYREPGLAHTA